MFAEALKKALGAEVIGQTGAVNCVVRGATRVLSGLTPSDRPYSAYLLMGPTGTGKSHLVETLARILGGYGGNLAKVDVSASEWAGDAWDSWLTELKPVFLAAGGSEAGAPETTPGSILLFEGLELGSKATGPRMARMLESRQVPLPPGRRGRLRNCLVFFTSRLCCREILEEPARMGFTGSLEDDDARDGDQEKVYQLCREEAEKHFGPDLLGQLDELIIFHRLEKSHLPRILDRRFARLERRLASGGLRCELQPAARDFLLEKGLRDLKFGARYLMHAHRRFVEFPLADLWVSGKAVPGSQIRVDRLPGEEHLHFTVDPAGPGAFDEACLSFEEIPIH